MVSEYFQVSVSPFLVLNRSILSLTGTISGTKALIFKRLDSRTTVILVGAVSIPVLLFGSFVCYEQGRYLWTYPQRKNALHKHWEIVIEDDEIVHEPTTIEEDTDCTSERTVSRPASELDLVGSKYDFRPLTIRLWHRMGDFVASLSPHNLFATLFSSRVKPASMTRRSSNGITGFKLRQRLYNSLCVAGRFVNPFYTFEDRNLTNLYDYVVYQMTRKNRNDVPSDPAILEKTMPLVTPRFSLLLEYTRQSHNNKKSENLQSSGCLSHNPSPTSSSPIISPTQFPLLNQNISTLDKHDEDNVSVTSSDGTRVSNTKESYNLLEDIMTVTWLGQSTCFIQMDGYNILTDPIFSSRTVGEWFGPKRIRPTPCEIDDLPKIDIVLVSHNHYDHLDRKIVQQLGNTVTWYVPLGLKSWFLEHDVSNVIELDWWQETQHKTQDHRPSLLIAGTPVQHWSGRHFFDVNSSLWSSFVVKGPNSSLFHCGDTGYCSVFKEIGDKYGPFTFTALPIGSYEPRYFLKHQHIDPFEAALIHKELRASYSIGVHWGTFMMSDEFYLDPPQRLEEARVQHNLPIGSLFTSLLGETILLPLRSDVSKDVLFEKPNEFEVLRDIID